MSDTITTHVTFDIHECFANPEPGGRTLHGFSGKSIRRDQHVDRYFQRHKSRYRYIPHLDAWILQEGTE